jgi:hypothetical protein
VRAALVAIPLLALAACAPGDQATYQISVHFPLHCDQPFADQVRAIAAMPGGKRAQASGEPYDYFNAEGGQTSYVVTRPEAPAHPAILIQQVEGGVQKTTGCAYGDRKAFDDLLAYIQGLGAAKGGGG